jgi:hypothetical protein
VEGDRVDRGEIAEAPGELAGFDGVGHAHPTSSRP